MMDNGDTMEFKTSIQGETGLPRYFGPVFETALKMDHGRLDMRLPDGRVFRAEGSNPGPAAQLDIHNPDIFGRLIREGDLGFCEAYLDGWWSTPDLQAFMDLVHADNEEIYDGFLGMPIIRAYERLRFRLQSNSKRQARKNISHHYDLGNEFYGLWLDDTMTYSSALFETGQEPTELAQTQKYASMVDQMGAKPGDHVLEIGCGWGGFAELAIRKTGCRVTGLTLSTEQAKFARARLEKAGFADRVDIRLEDYRDCSGHFDKIVSIEMFEAVGEENWPVYFEAVHKRLVPGGKALIQTITIDESRFDYYRGSADFIQTYIFPGGMLPSVTVFEHAAMAAGLEIGDRFRFGRDYDRTLLAWDSAFTANWQKIEPLGFDRRFYRMWRLYLHYCAVGFRFGRIDVVQFRLDKPA